MGKKLIGVIAIILFGIFVLIACNTQGNLEEYKLAAKKEVVAYATTKGQANYTTENWTLIEAAVENGKLSIDAAESKTEVDTLVISAKEAIDKVEKDRIKPMDGAEEYKAGSGVEDDPFIINNRGQLIHFSNQINNGENLSAYFALSANIDLDGMGWKPIGILSPYYECSRIFNGVFDGKGYEICNFEICTTSTDSYDNWGLFGCMTGNILNLGVTNFRISVIGRDICAGGIVGNMNGGSITNCYSIGNIEVTATRRVAVSASPSRIYAGGLAGLSQGIITNCYAACNVTAEHEDDKGDVFAAGLVGAIFGDIKNSYATGDVSAIISHSQADWQNAGRVFAVPSPIRWNILNCYAYEGQSIFIKHYADVSGDSPYILICSAEELNDIAFYLDKLGWSADEWVLEDLDFSDGKYTGGKYPRLKKYY